jgi:hypothetical protein
VRRPLAAFLVGVVLSPVAIGATTLAVASSGDASGWLRIDERGVHVRREGAKTVDWTLTPGTSVDTFVESEGGWVATGAVPVTGGRELALWTSDDSSSGVRSLPIPPERAAAVRAAAVPLVRDGALVGLVWLEGEASDRFGVRASTWNGKRWGRIVTIAAPGAGSQLGLTGTVLADGSWLVAWSAYDGEDDEVMWSVARNGRFSAPKPAAKGNSVPDVTPTLRADGDGALLAWSRYDGNDYRVVLSRFTSGRWSEPSWAAGPGTLLPRWQGRELSFRDAVHGAWIAASVDAADALRVEAAVAGSGEVRPVVARVDGVLRLLAP